ncbi:hypothetical protein D6T69_05655 [Tenacibaculum singaporense]|uniref:Oligosaccharide repeat unit polymerase n=1 Tax=Tenacibaculum singaporense TaxID=2358479 RepID=A0A3S8R5J5_9FLAO|nr:O-antigen polymerase [Tenacibaculum singaporense]AZJ35033.1 hypothetical protein D6T69_05655 [Tenacibaculum singaporense]
MHSFIHFFLLTFTTIICFKQIINIKIYQIRVFDFFNIIFFIVYCFFPLIISAIPPPNDFNDGWLKLYRHKYDIVNSTYYIKADIFILIGYLSILLSYNIKKYKVDLKETRFYFLNEKSRKVAWYMFIIGVLCIFLFIALEGFDSYISTNTRMAFANEKDDIKGSKFAFLISISTFLYFSTYIFWSLKVTSRSVIYKALFYISLFLSLLIFYRQSGRLFLLVFIFSFVLSNDIFKRKFNKIKYLAFGFFAAIFVLIGKSIFRFYMYDGIVSEHIDIIKEARFSHLLYEVIGEFSFPYLSLINNIIVNDNYYYFQDITNAILYILPRKLLGIENIFSTSDINTVNMLGSLEQGQVPSDILSYGYLNLGGVGVIITCVFFGFILRLIDKFSFSINNSLSVIVFISFSLIIALRVMYFDPEHFLRYNLYYFCGLILLKLNYNKEAKWVRVK